MFRLQNLKNSLRFIKKYRGFSAINISGLTLGIVCCLLIIMYVFSELTFDKFHRNGKNIYRVVMHQPGNQVTGSSYDWWVVSPAILKPTWERELPEVDLVTRTTNRPWTFKYSDQYLQENVMIVDPEFLDIFSFPLLAGDEKTALTDPYSIVLSREMAEKYFGKDDPMGKTMVMNDGKLFTVTGILEEIPGNSHLQFDFLASFRTLQSITGSSLLSDNWLNNSYTTYLTLHENTDLEALDKKLRKYDIDGFNGNTWTFHLQPLFDIHFNRQIRGTGNKSTIFIFITTGIFILFIACFNYLNLYISHYRTRIRDISIKKTIGASRSLLIRQFLSESFILVCISYLASLALIRLILPLLNSLWDQELNFQSIWNYKILLTSLGIIILMSFISSIYPAFYLSRLHLTDALRGGMVKLSKESQYFRKAIVIVQFSISIALIVGTITIFKQLKYAGNKNLGYQKENIIYLDLIRLYFEHDFTLINKIKTFKEELLRHKDIVGVTASTDIPATVGWSNMPVWEGKDENDKPFFYRMIVDYDFFDFYGIPLKTGRNFSRDMGTDDGNAYIINTAAAERMNFRSPVGAKFGFDGKLGSVIGVTKDFHFESLHKPIAPLGIGVNDKYFWAYVSIRIRNTNMQKTLEYIEDTWKNYVNGIPMKYSFIDEHLEQLYRKDRQLSSSMNYLSLMALFISCLGIFGLMSLSLKERTKEIGIRKVFGAPFFHLLRLLTWDVISVVGIATIAGGMLGWYLSVEWLKNFAYRVNPGFDIIIIAFITAIIMAIVPLCFKLFKSIFINPVISLRNE